MLAAPLCIHDRDVRSLERYMQNATAQHCLDLAKQLCGISLPQHDLMRSYAVTKMFCEHLRRLLQPLQEAMC